MRSRSDRQISAPPASAPADLPAGTPDWVTADLLADTIETWQPYYSRPLTNREALEIIQQFDRLLDVL